MKSYQFKHYLKNGDFAKVIDENLIMSNVSFSDSINWPQGRLSIALNIKWENLDFEQGDYIKVFCINEYFKSGYQIYYGYIREIEKEATTSENVVLQCYGVGALLNNVFHYSASQYHFSDNITIKQHIDKILDHFDTIYPWVIQKGTIEDYAGNVNMQYNYDSCFNALKRVTELKNESAFWYVDRLGFFHFKDFVDSPIKIATFQKDIQELTEKGEIEIVNKLILEYDGGSFETYSDSTSITKYGLYEKKVTDTNIKNKATADIFWAEYIAKYKEITPQVDIVLNDEFVNLDLMLWDDTAYWDDTGYWLEVSWNNKFEAIEVWDIIKVLNRKWGITGRVNKKNYTRDRLWLELGKTENIIWLIRNDGNNI